MKSLNYFSFMIFIILLSSKVLFSQEELLIPYYENGRWGFCDKNKNIIIPCQYQEASFFYNGLAPVVKDYKYGYIDKKGNVIVPFIYDYAIEFNNGVGRVAVMKSFNKALYAYVNTSGKKIVPVEYEELPEFKEGYLWINNQFYDTLGNIIPFEAEFVHPFSNGLARFRKKVGNDELYGFVDKTGKIVIPPQFDIANDFSEDIAAVWNKKNEKWGFINKSGKLITNYQYSWIQFVYERYKFKNGYCIVGKSQGDYNLYGLIDKNGKEIIPCKYTTVEIFSNDLAVISLNYKFGYVDKKGKIVIPCKFDDAYSFIKDVAFVKVDDKYGLIDRKSNFILKPKYHSVYLLNYNNILAIVELDKKFGLIDFQGNEIVPTIYDNIDPNGFSFDLLAVCKNNKWGYINSKGKEIIPCKYDKVGGFIPRFNGIGWVVIDKKTLCIDINGNEYWK